MLSANQKQQTTLGIVMKGKQDKRTSLRPYINPQCIFLSEIAVSVHLRGSEERESSMASVQGMRKAPQPDQEMTRGLGM